MWEALSVLGGSEQQELVLRNPSVSPAVPVLIQLLLLPGQTQTPGEGKQRPILDSEIKTQTHRAWHIPGTAAQVFKGFNLNPPPPIFGYHLDKSL